MQDSLTIVGITLAAFVSTNLDNLFILVGFLAASKGRTLRVHAGFTLAIIAILLFGVGAANAADFAPARYAGWLGVVPIAMGLHILIRLLRGGNEAMPETSIDSATSVLTVAFVTLANAGDSFAVFLPLFADTEDSFIALIFATGLAATLVWCALAAWLLKHPTLGRALRRVGPRLLPFLMIGVGVYVLINTGTDTLFAVSPNPTEIIPVR
jgi:cadmium resistance protein CadD (predicted permease)